MLNIRTLWIVALAELRSCCRLVRTWLFIAVTLIFCTLWYINAWDYADWISSFLPSYLFEDQVTAQYTILTYVNGFVSIFSIAIILLAFDIRERAIHSRFSDVLDSLSASKLEITFGRIAGILLLVMIPCLVVLLLVTAGNEIVSILSETRFRLGIKPVSVMSLVAWNLIPNLIFYSALVACLVALVRIRLLIAAIALGVLLALFWIDTQIPVRFQESLSQFPSTTLVTSDLAPVFVTPAMIGNKLVVLLVSSALFLFAASVLTRSKPGRLLTVVSGASAIGVAFILLFVLIGAVHRTENLKEEWVNEHRRHSPASFPDIQHLTGVVELLPGRKIILDVILTVHPPSKTGADSVVLSLNPGYKHPNVYIDGIQTKNFSFERGILELSSDLLPDFSHEIRVQAEGKPNDRFAYLDQARDLQTLSDVPVRQLGLQNSIFHKDFIALMPSVAWYPISGTITDRDDLESRPRDLFTTDLTVTVPKSWQVATVGKRTVLEHEQRNKFRFRSGAPVPELALVASKFDQRVTTIEGVEFEVLFNKNHLQNLEALAPFSDRVLEWVAERIKNASRTSLVYPYEVFYVVEVPSNLRIYGGGWRMDTVLQPPGMMLIRESNFPQVRFENVIARIRGFNGMSKEEQEALVFNELLRYFGNDMQGGSPFVGFDRNFVSHQISVTQRGATALQFLLERLSNQLITQMESLSITSLQEFGKELPYLAIGRAKIDPYPVQALSPIHRRKNIAGIPSTWNAMDRLALFDVDYAGNPIESYRVLLTRGHALAKSMISFYGEELIGKFLDQLLTQYRGQSITVADFLGVASEVGLDFDEWVQSALEDTSLPGFLVEPAAVSKLDLPELDETQYQTTFVVYNSEPVPGLVRVLWTTTSDKYIFWLEDNISHSNPILIAGHHAKRFALRSATPLTGLWIDPFLAYNRDAIEVQILKNFEHTDVTSPPLPFVANVDWRPPETEAIVVDDLDPNFSIVKLDRNTGNFVQNSSPSKSSNTNTVYITGLPVGPDFLGLNEWHREFDPSSFGSYLRTFAIIAAGAQKSAARFKVNLPQDGRWNLEYYVSREAFRPTNVAIVKSSDIDWYHTRPANSNAPEEHYTLTIRDGHTDWDEKFDIANANVGWNAVGVFELSSTDIEVLVSASAGHKEVMVFADAIRWTPVSDTAENEESSP
ncbi:MAG: hypothetical protein F4W92_04040 [Gammaproteobacteria bacterium]|nr:hypothetical protein [Gammaproteobacteria bacterium]